MPINPVGINTSIQTPLPENADRDAMLKAFLTAQQGSIARGNKRSELHEQDAINKTSRAQMQKEAEALQKNHKGSAVSVSDSGTSINPAAGMRADQAAERQRAAEAQKMSAGIGKELSPLHDQATKISELHGMLDNPDAYNSKAFGYSMARILEGKSARVQLQAAKALGMPSSVGSDAASVSNFLTNRLQSGVSPEQASTMRHFVVDAGNSLAKQYGDAVDRIKKTSATNYPSLSGAGLLDSHLQNNLSSYGRPFDELSQRAKDFAASQKQQAQAPQQAASSPAQGLVSQGVDALKAFFTPKQSAPQQSKGMIDGNTLSQYAQKHGISPEQAKDFLGKQGYGFGQ